MSDFVSKLEIIKELSQAPETKQVCEVMIEYIKANDKKQIGFKK